MNASENFKSAIENYLNQKVLIDSAFAPNLEKASKNLEACINYIFGEVKKTGLCAFENQEIFDMAVKYYTDDSINSPAPMNCKVVINQPVKADLFTPAPSSVQNSVQKTEMVQSPKPAQTTLTLFDL